MHIEIKKSTNNSIHANIQVKLLVKTCVRGWWFFFREKERERECVCVRERERERARK